MTQIALAWLVIGILFCVGGWLSVDAGVRGSFGESAIKVGNYVLTTGLILIAGGIALAAVEFVMWIL